MHRTFHLLGYAYGDAAGDSGCQAGPLAFKQSTYWQTLQENHTHIRWDDVFYPLIKSNKYETTAAICQQLAIKIQTLIQKGHRVITLGGDHSSAIGTWHGVKQAVAAQGNIGLIWVDAHMDSHTPQTSVSGNIHGMPLAVLLGYGDERLTQLAHLGPTLLPQNVCLIGIRSFESGEAQLLNRLGVRVFYRDEIKQRGLTAVFQEALSIVNRNTVGFGVSVDLDAIDPNEAPGVGSPTPDGLRAEALCQALRIIAMQPRFLAAEIAEFNPHHDQQQKTANVIYQLITHLTGGVHHEPTHQT